MMAALTREQIVFVGFQLPQGKDSDKQSFRYQNEEEVSMT